MSATIAIEYSMRFMIVSPERRFETHPYNNFVVIPFLGILPDRGSTINARNIRRVLFSFDATNQQPP